MEIPAILLGEYAEVKQRVKALPLGPKGTLPITDIFGPVVDVNDFPLVQESVRDSLFGGALASPLIVVREKRIRIEGTHFRPNVLAETFHKHFRGDEKEWYGWCFEVPWRFILVLGDGAPPIFYGGLQSLRDRYLEAALAFAVALDRVGKRFFDIGSAQAFSEKTGPLSGMAKSAGDVADERIQRTVAAIREHLRQHSALDPVVTP